MAKHTAVSYYGMNYAEHAEKDFIEMKEHGCDTVILALTEFDIDFWFPNINAIVKTAHKLGMRCLADPWGIGKYFGGEQVSLFLQNNVHHRQVTAYTGEVLPEGEKGELVFTALDKEAFPLLRYRTRDICVLSRKKCSCGRTLIKMAKPMGRTDDMLIIRGVNVFPSQIETVLLNEGYQPNYQIVVDRVNNNDTFDVNVELTPEQFTDKVGEILAMEKSLANALKTMLGINPSVHLVAPKTIARSEGKAVRVIDKRKLV